MENYVQNGQTNSFKQSANEFTVSEKPKKSHKVIVIAAIICLVVVVAVIAVVVVMNLFRDVPSGESPAGISYTKGEVKDGVYVNEWAGLKMTIPDGFESRDDIIESVSSFGFYLSAGDPDSGYRTISISFDNEMSVDAVKYMHNKKIIQLAGTDYLSYSEDMSYQFMYYAARQIDDRLVTITAIAPTEEQAKELMSYFEEYNGQ